MREGLSEVVDDRLAIEEPLEIAVKNGSGLMPMGVVFRTPGDDESLVLGMLFSEGVIDRYSDVLSIRFTQEKGATMPSWRAVAKVTEDVKLDFEKNSRVFPISSACGACGKSALEALRIQRKERFDPRSGARIELANLLRLPDLLLAAQAAYQDAGSLHAAARFSANGSLLDAAEDIGRHNAMDKLVGSWLKSDSSTEWSEQIILFSGRIGYDLMQKAIVAGCPFLVSIGAPSSFAVELANLFEVTLVGFLRGKGFTTYSAPYRILMD